MLIEVVSHTMVSPEDNLVDFIVNTGYNDIPEETLNFTKQLSMKTIAGMVAGSVQPTGRKMVNYTATRSSEKSEAGVIGCGFQTSLTDAILANATFAHASELEDDMIDSERGVSSWDITTFPVTFTLAERYRLSGKEFLTASAVGLEVLTRLSLSPNKGPKSDIPLQSASMGAAAAAAKAMRLDKEAVSNSLGLASGGGFVFTPLTGTEAHYLDSAFQCTRGFRAAELAKDGFTGELHIDELFTALYGDDAIPADEVVAELGEEWLFRNIGIKKYPCCFFTHKYLDLLNELVAEADAAPADIESIHATTGAVEANLIDIPDPKTAEDAKFSLQHLLGAALVEGDVNYGQVSEESLTEPAYVDARSKVSVSVGSETDVPFSEPARITLELTSGDTINGEREHMIGSPQEPLSEEDHLELYRKFTKAALNQETIEATETQIADMENLQDLQKLSEALVYREP